MLVEDLGKVVDALNVAEEASNCSQITHAAEQQGSTAMLKPDKLAEGLGREREDPWHDQFSSHSHAAALAEPQQRPPEGSRRSIGR
jgi:hypothetical protein